LRGRSRIDFPIRCGAQPGAPLELVADLRHMHLIDEESGLVL
jgi:hypothetical protein